jgi:TonB family protein
LRLSTVIVSVGLHAALAMGLISVAQKRELKRKAISVAVAEEKKKSKPKPPPPPKPIAHPAVAKASVAPKAVAAAPVHVAAAPLVTNLAMSNDDLDIGPGIGLHGSVAPKAAAAAAPTKVASAISERRTQHTREEAGGGGPEATCQEEPTKPEAIVQTPAIDYTLYPQAQADGVEGKFKAKLVIDADGEVSSVIVVTGVEPAFDAAIVAALKHWRFKPAMACGKPVAGGVVPFNARFELGD